MMVSLLLLQVAVAAPALVREPAPVSPTHVSASQAESRMESRADNDITVVGRTPSETADILRRCIARQCPPKQDMQASMDHAENQYMVGDYQGASVTLSRARGRNDRYAKQYPIQVSNLRQFKADMSSLVGFADVSRVGAIDALSALKAGLRQDDVRIERQRLVIGDSFVRQGRIRAGSDVYDGVARRAHVSGRPALEGEALLRGAALYAGLAEALPEYATTANRRFDALRATTDPAMKTYRGAIALYKARLAYRRGDSGPLDRLMADDDARTTKAVIVVEPPIDLKMDNLCESIGKYDPAQQWIDVDFRVTADGRVSDLIERRRGRNAEDHWIERVKASLAKRRYLPLTSALATTGIARRERFSLVADVEPQTITRIQTNCGSPRVVTTDLTPDQPSATG